MSLAISPKEHAAICDCPTHEDCWGDAMRKIIAREYPHADLKATVASCAAHADQGEPDATRRIWTAATPMLLHSIQQYYALGPNAAPGLSVLLQVMGGAADLAHASK
jgi:hypothetical protein